MTEYYADDEVVILDFETTGISSDYERIIEVGAAIVKGEQILDTFSSLCNPGITIPSFITELTGITNSMVAKAPKPEAVMSSFYEFVGARPILAHNASFDSRFLHAEMARVGKTLDNTIVCTLLLSRRLFPEALNHKLGTLKHYIGFKESKGHSDHRALDDVMVTAELWKKLKEHVFKKVGHNAISIKDFKKLSKVSMKKINATLEEWAKSPVLVSSP